MAELECQIAALNRQVREQGQIGKQELQIAAQKRQIDELKKLIEELRRRGKRQAAPCSKGEPSADPYREIPVGIEVVAVAHHKRRPRYWLGGLRRNHGT